ncbi:hypothetical protein ACTMU2_37415 [Cupriavidus basilensis]
MATILLIEPHALLRLGLRLLAQARHSGDLIDLDPLAPIESDLWLHDADLLVFGLPSDPVSGCAQLAEVCERLQPQRVLVLAAVAGRCAVRGGAARDRARLHARAQHAPRRWMPRCAWCWAGGECFPSCVQLEHASGASAADVAEHGMLSDVTSADDERHVVALHRAGPASTHTCHGHRGMHWAADRKRRRRARTC